MKTLHQILSKLFADGGAVGGEGESEVTGKA